MMEKIKRQLRWLIQKVINLYKMIKWKRGFIYLFKRVSLFTIITFALIIFAWCKIPTELPIVVSSSIMILIFTRDLLQGMLNFTDFRENIWLSKPYKRKKEKSLYRWSEGIDIDERFIYRILKERCNDNPIKNLNSIKKLINKECSGKISNPRLLKAYIDRSISLNILSRSWTVFIGVIIGIVTSAFSKLSSTKDFIQKVSNFINHANVEVKISFIIKIVNYATWLLMVFMVLMYMWYLFTRDKNRLKLISNIIDVSILEKESKLDKNCQKFNQPSGGH